MPKFATKAADNMFCQARYEAAKFNERLAMKKLLRLVRASGMQEKQKNCYTGSRELTQSCSRRWTLQVWKKIS